MDSSQGFVNGQRVIYQSDFYGKNPGTVIQVLDTPDGRFYNVSLDKNLPGALCGKVVQLRADVLHGI